MFGSTSSLFGSPAGSGLQSQTSAAGNLQTLPLPQKNYLSSLHQRLQRVEALINDEGVSALQFSYELESSAGAGSSNGAPTRAQQRNHDLQKQIQQLQQQSPQEAGELLVKWQRAVERNPDVQDGVIVPVRGWGGLKARVTTASQRAKLLTEAAAALCKESESLNKKHAEMNEALERVRRRHALLSHSFIQVVALIEGVAWRRGISEANPRGEAANEQLLIRLQKEFRWSQWQERIDVLRVWLSTLKREQQEAKRSLSSEKKRRPLGCFWRRVSTSAHFASTLDSLSRNSGGTSSVPGKHRSSRGKKGRSSHGSDSERHKVIKTFSFVETFIPQKLLAFREGITCSRCDDLLHVRDCPISNFTLFYRLLGI